MHEEIKKYSIVNSSCVMYLSSFAEDFSTIQEKGES